MAMQLVTSLPHKVVQTQLARIVSSRQFCNAPRLSRFLTYVVEQSLAGQSDRLKGYTIGLEVFDKDPDFDPQTDTIVRVQARALRQKLDQYYAQDGADDPVFITIAKGGYEPSFYALFDGEKPIITDAPQRISLSTKPSLAILPFEQIGPKHDFDFLCHGLTEGTISYLSRFKDLSVFSRSTTQRAKLDRLSIGQMYDLFHPDFVLEGSFRVRKDLIQTRIKLIDAAKDEIIMTDRIDVHRDHDDIYDLLDEIVIRIAARIGVEYGPIGHYAQRAQQRDRPLLKWETYACISRFYQDGLAMGQAERNDLRADLKTALDSDPASSDGYATLAMIDIENYRAMADVQGNSDTLDSALRHALLAVKYDSENAMAFQSLAIAYFYRRQFVDFRAQAKQALALNPGHSDMLTNLGTCFAAIGDWDEALPLLDRAITLNPVHPSWYHIPKAIFLAMTYNPEEALAEIAKAPLPGHYAFHQLRLWFQVELGDMQAATLEKEQLLAAAPEAEKLVIRNFDIWCVTDEFTQRVISAFRKVGLQITD